MLPSTTTTTTVPPHVEGLFAKNEKPVGNQPGQGEGQGHQDEGHGYKSVPEDDKKENGMNIHNPHPFEYF